MLSCLKSLARLLVTGALALTLSGPAWAVQPDEILDNPVLEKRARTLSLELRCLVCQNQSIDDSDAPLARDLRLLVRERLEAGDSDKDVLNYMVERYGEFVLLRPRFSARNALLWATPVLVLTLGGLAMVMLARRRGNVAVPPLSKAEEEQLNKLLKDENGSSPSA